MCYASTYGGHHGRELTTYKVVQFAFFWPSLFKDTIAFVKGYDKCQSFGTIFKRRDATKKYFVGGNHYCVGY